MEFSMKRLIVFLLLGAFPLFTSAQTAVQGSFEVVKTKTFDGEKFVFPEGMRGTVVNVVFLGMSNSQDNGQLQQEQLLDWQAALDAEGLFSNAVMAYHFPAMSSPPFFVKGIISRAMSESYEGKVPMNQAGVLFLDDLAEFAAAADLPLDDQPTIVIADSKGKPLKVFKGVVSDAGVAELAVAIRDAAGQAPAGG
jgi:hypothetical protein